MKKLIIGENDLKTLYPEIAKHWDMNKNILTPEKVSPFSNKKAWWVCDKGHSFDLRIGHMVNSGENTCPYCSGNRVLYGFNDLLTTDPQIAIEWDYDKNELSPKDISRGSHYNAWWKCNNGHSYQTKVSTRTILKTNCPYCAHQKTIVGVNDLPTTNPELLKEWNYKRNKINPTEVFAQSNKKVWWVCDKGHEWEAVISSRIRGLGCPYCSNRKVLVGYNDLATTNTDLLKEWNYNKNTSVSPKNITSGSDKKVWWICEKGHEWQAIVSSRSKGNSCPICAKEHQSSYQEKAIYYYLKKAFPDTKSNVRLSFMGKREFDVFVPSLNLAIEYDGAKWHQNTENDKLKDELCAKHNIQIIRIIENGCAEYDSNAIKIKVDYHSSNTKYLENGIIKLFNIVNNLYNLNTSINCDLKRDNSEILNELISYNKTISFGVKFPHLIKYWDKEKNGNITPYMISYNSNKKYWWKCSRGHEFEATCSSVSRKKASDKEYCPYCSNKRIIEGENDFATLKPNLVKYWDYKNNEIKPNKISIGSPRKVWLICDRGHSFQAELVQFIKSNGKYCPYCSGKKAIIGETDLATTHPHLMKEWDYTKNTILPQNVSKGSDKKIWWICQKEHSWQASVSSRVAGSGCPICAIEQNKRKVLNIDTNEIFGSASDAAKHYGFKSSTHIRNCCLKIKKTAYGFHWKFIDEEK